MECLSKFVYLALKHPKETGGKTLLNYIKILGRGDKKSVRWNKVGMNHNKLKKNREFQ